MVLEAQMYRADVTGRQNDRAKIDRAATLREASDRPLDVQIRDMSLTGARVQCTASLPIGSEIWLGLPGLRRRKMQVVRREGDEYGCRFLTPLQAGNIETVASIDGTVLQFFNGESSPSSEPIVVTQKWPVIGRVAFIVGSSTLLWTMTLSQAYPLLF